jgi:thiol-disulfide isomerase/thioredoxin
MPHLRSTSVVLLAGAAIAVAACAGGARAHRTPTAPPRGSGVAYASGAARPMPATPPRAYAGGPVFAARDGSVEQALAGGRAAGKPVALYFLASWCGYCKRLDANTLSDASVQQEMRRYYNVRVDPDSPGGRALASRYGISGFPTVLILDAQGGKAGTLAGYREPLDMCSRLRAGR